MSHRSDSNESISEHKSAPEDIKNNIKIINDYNINEGVASLQHGRVFFKKGLKSLTQKLEPNTVDGTQGNRSMNKERNFDLKKEVESIETNESKIEDELDLGRL